MRNSVKPRPSSKHDERGTIKCVVWDLDNTLWEGVLLEDDHVFLRDTVLTIIKTLDNRGILQSIASKNDVPKAMQKLRECGIQEYFLSPQIGWSSKVHCIKKIAQALHIGLEAIALIDDQPFERGEVRFSLPQVLCLDAAELPQLLDMPAMNPPFLTEDSKMRRQMYMNDIARNEAENTFVGPKEAFLASLKISLIIFPAQEEDLRRAEELTVRTHQLNTTGYTYSYEELNHFRRSEHYHLLMAKLEDTYGRYGHIGLALIECQEEVWTIKLLLMSCRVLSRGVGSVMLNHVMKLAKTKNVRLRAEFVSHGQNRMMNITYRLAGFYEIERVGDHVVFENNLKNIPPIPDYVKLQTGV